MPKKGKKKKVDDFVHLHVHSDHSSLDGCATVKGYMEECSKRGAKAVAFTEHGSMRSFYDAHIHGENTGVKPIYGIEFYVASDMERKGLTDEERRAIGSKIRDPKERREAVKAYEDEHGIRNRWHITAWAENNQGLKNLFRLSTLAFKKGFYYKPRIDLQTLCEFQEGVAVATGCMSSPFHDWAIKGKNKRALSEAEKLYDVFGERFFIELQPHDIPGQRVSNKFGLFLKNRLEKPKLLATQDAHYIGQDECLTHEVMLCIGTRDRMSNPDRFTFDNHEFFLKNRKQMYRSFEKYHKYMSDDEIKEALDSTVLFADRCTAQLEIDYHKAILPSIPLPKEFSNEFEYIKHLCVEGFFKRLTPEHIARVAGKKGATFDEMFSIYRERLKHELRILNKQKFVKYFLIVEDLYRWVREQKIMYGPGRGSAAGSLVTFVLGITVVDPIEHNLLFERFINADRIDLPDIDMDFEKSRRQEILDHLREQYGEDRVCQITTVSKLTGKQCLKDVSRVFDVPFGEANEITNNIMDDSSEGSTIKTALKDSKVCREFDKKYPGVFDHAIRLEGMSKHLGVHAGGVIITPDELTNYIPVELRKHHGKEILISAVDKKALEAMSLVKFDILGLKTLSILRETLEFIEKFEGEKIDIYADLSFSDTKTFKGFNDGDFVGVFQFDTPGAEKICEGVKFKDFEDIVTLTSLNRPGATRSGLAAQYLDKKIRRKKFESLHEKIDEIAADSLGVLVYQEHIMQIFSELAGYSLSDADKIRKKISKSAGPEELEKEREGFVDGAVDMGIDKEVANKIMDTTIAFGGYAFTKCLTADTQLYRADRNQYTGRKLTIKQLFDAQNSRAPWGKKIRAGRMRILQYDDDGRIRPGYVKAVYYNGRADVFHIKFESGRQIKATGNHRFLTNEGYTTVSDFNLGTKVVCIGQEQGYEKKSCQCDRTKGEPSDFDTVSGVEHIGCRDVYDLEMNEVNHNFVANGLVSHNSHAAAYSIISYWCMYLKRHYPLHFYCALLRNEEAKEKVQVIAKSAKKRGIDILQPHVSVSGKKFSVDFEAKAIRGSLSDLVDVGDVAASNIEDNAPYSDFIDFVERIDRRKVNKGVVLSLLKADALSKLIPNQKWLIEHFEDIWPLMRDDSKRNRTWDLLRRSKNAPDYTDDERKMIALKFNPSLSDVDVFSVYKQFMDDNVFVPIARIGDEGFFDTYDEKGVFIAGIVLDTKVSKVGDFHTGEELTDEEKKQKNFGARIAKMNIEDISGENIRIKFDYDVFEDLQKVINASFGTPIIAHCHVNARWKSLKVTFAINLEEYREKIMKGEKLSIWEEIISGKHPATIYKFKNEKEKRDAMTNDRFKNTSSRNLFCGVVTNVQEKIDRNGNRMAFFGMIGADNYYVKVVCFKDSWRPLRKEFLPGRLFKMELEKGKRSKFGKSETFNGGLVKWLRCRNEN